jgi:hypothetical protein
VFKKSNIFINNWFHCLFRSRIFKKLMLAYINVKLLSL